MKQVNREVDSPELLALPRISAILQYLLLLAPNTLTKIGESARCKGVKRPQQLDRCHQPR